MSKRAKEIEEILKEALEHFDFDNFAHKAWSKEGEVEWVSEFDLKLNRFLTKRLNKVFPDERVVSEEGEDFDYRGHFWIIDPLDGTHNFLLGSPFFGINVAYCQEGQVIAAGILLPHFKEYWVTQKGEGVWQNGELYKREREQVLAKPFVFGMSALRQASLGYLKLLKGLSASGFSVRLNGSGAVSFPFLAKTAGLFVFEKPCLWDVAAGILLIQELGGQVLDLQKKQWSFESESLVVTAFLEEAKKKKAWELINRHINGE